MTEGRLTKTWEVSALNRETNEWTTVLNHSYDHTDGNLPIEPVVPAHITPDRRKPLERDYQTLFVFSDAQIGYRRIENELVPIHDERAIKAAQLFARWLRPNFVIDCGDTTDFAELGHFAPDSDHFLGTLQPSLQRTHNMLAEFTAATPDAERHTVGSNHVARLAKYVLKNAPALWNVKAEGDKYPIHSYAGLLKLDDIGWNYHDGYPVEYEYSEDLAFIHGTLAVSNGSTAQRLSKENYGRNIVQGHKHSIESHYSTDRRGHQFGAFVVGALCRIDGAVPSYHSAIGDNQTLRRHENWQNGILVIRDYGEGHYQFDQVPINDGTIKYNGKVFNGNE